MFKMLSTLLLLSILATAIHALPEPTLEFEIQQLATRHDVVSRSDQATFSRPLYNNITWQKFTINVAVGTPPQTFPVMLDSGSADLWVPSPDSPACTPNCPKTFDKSKDSTYRETGLEFNISYGFTPDLQMTGPYFNSTVRIGPAVIHNQTLGLPGVIKPIYDVGNFGIMGLGPPQQEAMYASYGKTYPVVYERLFQAGYIKKRVFSIWLNSKNTNFGSILFGGYDSSRYHGQLGWVPVPGEFTDWHIKLDSVVLDEAGKKTNLSSTTLRCVLDSGSPNMYLPASIAEPFAKALNATMLDGYNGPFPYVACNAGKNQYLEFQFDAGVKIRVPASEVVYPFGAPANVGPKYDASGNKLCYLGLQTSPAPNLNLLGATFMRAAYVVFDADNQRVGLGQAKC